MERSSWMADMERRTKTRYPVELRVRYRTLGRKQRVLGNGRTLNLSSQGILISSQHQMPVGMRLEVTIEWPARLDNSIPLQLVMTGKVVRAGGTNFALEFAHPEFRTMSTGIKPPATTTWDSGKAAAVRAVRA